MTKRLRIVNIDKFFEINEEPSDFNLEIRNYDQVTDFYSENELGQKGIISLPSLDKISKLLNEASDDNLIRKFNNLSSSQKVDPMHRDKYLGVNFHKTIHISRVQASRFEFWNSIVLQVPEFIKYAKKRETKYENTSDKEIKQESLILNEAELLDFHILSSPWWITEMTRNGNDYSTSVKTFELTSVFYRRWTLRTEMHINYIFIALVEFLTKKKWKECLKDIDETIIHKNMKILIDILDETAIKREIAINLLTALTEYLSTNEYLLIIPESVHKINYENYQKWLYSESIEGPNDFKFSDLDIEKFSSQFEKILLTFYKKPIFTKANTEKIKNYL